MKYVIILMFVFIGCNNSNKKGFVVYSHESDSRKVGCQYDLQSNMTTPAQRFTFSYFDSCGLYAVGDTLILIKKP